MQIGKRTEKNTWTESVSIRFCEKYISNKDGTGKAQNISPENYTVTGDHTFTAQWSANSAKLPKTGQTTWPIPVFTVMGTALIVYGLIRRKKEEKENAS